MPHTMPTPEARRITCCDKRTAATVPHTMPTPGEGCVHPSAPLSRPTHTLADWRRIPVRTNTQSFTIHSLTLFTSLTTLADWRRIPVSTNTQSSPTQSSPTRSHRCLAGQSPSSIQSQPTQPSPTQSSPIHPCVLAGGRAVIADTAAPTDQAITDPVITDSVIEPVITDSVIEHVILAVADPAGARSHRPSHH